MPIRARLCDRFGASHPTVETNVRRLARAGYVRRETIASSSSRVTAGRSRRPCCGTSRVAVRFLEALGVDEATVHTDAEQWALVMSDDVAEALSELLDGESSSFD